MDFLGKIPGLVQNLTKEGPIPRQFEAPLKDEAHGLLPMGRGRKREFDNENVLLSNNKKPKLEETQISENCKDVDTDDSLSELHEIIGPTIPARIPFLEHDSQDDPAPEESSYPDSSCVDETEIYWIQKTENFKKVYKEQNLLGKGGFGSIYAGIRLNDDKSVALKHIPKAKVKYLQGDGGKLLVFEALLLLHAGCNLTKGSESNPGIIELLDIIELKDEFVLVMERPDNAMDLHSYSKKKNHEWQEQEVKVIIKQILKAAFIMHKNGVFHRDIKAENILISNTNGTPSVKIIDFGCGDWVKDVPYERMSGTLSFAPPEYFAHKKYQAEQTTVWQIGLLIHNLYTCVTYSTLEHVTGKRRIINRLSKLGNNFVMQCLKINPAIRLGLDDLLDHPWLRV
ncbi:serine/threonine-protein kinase pim-2-like isoform X1 [Gouania willdenowi]|uniref:serine/threonine-protein kinase pim-2-like isoform X1 n=1 Tax=Gouania willdenowi TaxID=441366 RepID=UPI0010563EC9|nr:serine/threonine-protein kinase pim-2-like isoform X1 [Gouania willdenowi]